MFLDRTERGGLYVMNELRVDVSGAHPSKTARGSHVRGGAKVGQPTGLFDVFVTADKNIQYQQNLSPNVTI
jgi:hypothetical protein